MQILYKVLPLLVLPILLRAQPGCSTPPTTNLGNGWTAIESCLEWTNGPATTVVITDSPTAGHGILIGGYMCSSDPSCATLPSGTIALKDNINNPETCFKASPQSPIVNNSGANAVLWYWWFCPSIPSGVTSFTLTGSTSFSFAAAWLLDLTGNISVNAIDTDGFSESAAGGTSASVCTGQTLSSATCRNTGNLNDLIIGMLDTDNGVTNTIGGGWSEVQSGDGSGTGILQAKSVTLLGQYTATVTWTGTETWEGYIVALKSSSLSPCALSLVGAGKC